MASIVARSCTSFHFFVTQKRGGQPGHHAEEPNLRGGKSDPEFREGAFHDACIADDRMSDQSGDSVFEILIETHWRIIDPLF